LDELRAVLIETFADLDGATMNGPTSLFKEIDRYG
jgi:predicted nuclease of restriction endonuclease-like RecB superfamily